MIRNTMLSIKKLIGIGAVLMLGLSTVNAQQNVPQELIRYADTVYVNATIITLDDHEMNSNPGTIAQAMAIRDEIILALGTNDEMRRLAGPQTEIIDLKGKTVLPGLVDQHTHPMGGSESRARILHKLRNTPQGYALNMDISPTTDETMAKVAKAMELLLATVQPAPDDWINISLVHNPEFGFATPADVSTLMSAPRLVDVAITKEDLTEIVPNYPFILSSATSVLSAPERNVWYYVTEGPDGQALNERIIEIE